MAEGVVDVAVIGRGMIGSAAARHLAEAKISVALIGAGEAPDYGTSAVPFASHYDQGRITRISDSSSVWSTLAARSIERYADIAARSGIGFHTASSLAHVSDQPDALLAHCEANGGRARVVSREWLREQTGISISPECSGQVVYEDPPAGHINPRRLVEAQTALTRLAGGKIIDAAANSIASTATGFVVATEHGDVAARRVLLATGAYGANLGGVDLALERRLRTIVLAELGPDPEIPSLIVERVRNPALEEIYWVPPVAFPEGRVMLKIGGTMVQTEVADNDADIARWFQQGGSIYEVAALRSTVHDLLPGASITSWDHKPCVVTATSSGRPYVGFIADDLAVAVGGNGAAAKSCDEIGRLAASLFGTKGWAGGDLDQLQFSPQLAT